MSDVLSQFASLLEQSSAAGGSIELLVLQLGDESEIVRRCAIPHQFNHELLQVLDPRLDAGAATAQFHRLARLSMVIRSPDGLALHDRAREQLFADWLSDDRIEELREISEGLVTYFAARKEAATGVERETLARRELFHRMAVDQDGAIDELERVFKAELERVRYTACDNVLRMAHEYDRVLTPANRARLAYREGQLALARRATDRALELFESVVHTPAAGVSHHAKALDGIGLAHADECRWRSAAMAFLDALAFAEKHAETRPFRSGFLLHLATVYRDTGHVEAAEALLVQASAMAGGSTRKGMAALVHNTFGTLYLRAGEPTKAIDSLKRSLDHLSGDDFVRSRVYNNLGLAAMRLPDLAASEEWFTRSLEMKALAGDSVGQANTHINLVRLHREQRALDKAIAAASVAADLFARVAFWKEAGDANAMLARFTLEANMIPESAKALVAASRAYGRANASEERDLLRREFLRQSANESVDDVDLVAGRLAQLREHAYVTGKNPVIAGLLSLVVPGGGQIYNADRKKALAMLVFGVCGVLVPVVGSLLWLAAVAASVTDAWNVANGSWRRW